MHAVERVGRVVERAYNADGLTIACQDGPAAGQTVPHVHIHLLPRRLQGDRFAGTENDVVYTELEKQEGTISHDLASASQGGSRSPEPLRVDADALRNPRSLEDMEQEARWLAGFFEADK
jgi:bis(5'-adenosyl)-triphosphatase